MEFDEVIRYLHGLAESLDRPWLIPGRMIAVQRQIKQEHYTRQQFAQIQTTISDLERKVKELSKDVEGHYEVIKELCTAILAIDGWKALNHECLFAYLQKKKNLVILNICLNSKILEMPLIIAE
ncbi:hypothetical protein J4457_05805 [Candidatus Woesearchaeota archaeon]|nr:hypothetical protein [Candidatus Woesearchaeota archaeon]